MNKNMSNGYFKVQFNSSKNEYSNLKFSKSVNNFKPKTNTGSSSDIYYDEIIIYDGGDVDGYGDD